MTAVSLPDPDDPETAAAFAICMNAINFGSGWWPTIRKRPGHSGYGTMAAAVTDRFAAQGGWSAGEPDHPLMLQFAAALRDVGDRLQSDHAGRFLGPVEAADSIPALAAASPARAPAISPIDPAVGELWGL